MSRNTKQKSPREEELDGFDIGELLMGSPEEETMLEMLSQVAQIEHHQMEISIELTRLMIGHSTDSKRKEEDILSAFKKAKQTVSSCSALQEVFQRISS